ncbi:hypothetical protein CH333_10565 [candidate division WOR-3 bacterium JGI_Cruoil_03_44_89]|uniref:Nucleoside phosphorylase domain-containing protein n=1 Tax=candidate division WOR-3 bacterium JGI_Cruoil_03_44_89 TaxID=1973748 RepID=A0A235BMH1_UNCW3|nr:MAG: hypothetical protein CH333_10565 [candidate division WOR-3 bacterium JGI_Cruoil_03_44_89]
MNDNIDCKSLEKPILTATEALETRRIQNSIPDSCVAIVCFRGRRASDRLIKRLGGVPIQGEIIYGHRLYYSSEFNLLIVPGAIYGGPIIAIIIEELFALGVKVLIGFGAGGSINHNVQPGSIFIAKKVICRDGTSKEYSDMKNCEPDSRFLNYYAKRKNELDTLFLNGLTTDSLYRETPRKIKDWRQLGADFINLEISPFYVVSKVLDMRSIYIGLITDFVGEKWENTYWNKNYDTKDKIDSRIIETIKELVMEKSLVSDE